MTPRAARVETPADVLRRAAWVARVSPTWLQERSPISEPVAEPLAAWLDQEAASADRHVEVWRRKRPDGWDGEIGDPWIDRDPAEHAALVRNAYGHALALARALLASPVPEPDGEGT